MVCGLNVGSALLTVGRSAIVKLVQAAMYRPTVHSMSSLWSVQEW